ncbi:MAG TPA: nucleotide exchange factor GrpE, partial [Pseudobdellovibrionaceae bacterium]|nr:nucleotide exchange factor GrpE [Pseudobdellovibrionaceae bacterium]
GHVFRVFQKAYKMHDKLIRPAQVVVAKKPE